jgi:SAM-dependent methyltransferase
MNTCNICNFTGKFISHRKIPNRKCPICKSLQRQRNLFSYLQKNSIKDKTVLHIAPEKCLIKPISLMNAKNYILADKNCLNNLNWISLDMTDMGIIENSSVDLIIVFHVLEHIQNDELAIKESYRVMKPGGSMLISVPISGDYTSEWSVIKILEEKKKGLWGLPGKYDGHYRTYGRKDIELLFYRYYQNINISNNPITSEDFFICTK